MTAKGWETTGPTNGSDMDNEVPVRELVEPEISITISVVVPVYRGADCLDELYVRLSSSLAKCTNSYEIVLVEDCGPDDSWTRIKELAGGDPRVRGLQFSRNFGQHYGITAGIDYARGDWIVVMDCDLQDRPEEIPRLYAAARGGWDIVLARRQNRRDALAKRITSAVFYRVFGFLTDIPYDGSVGNFRIISRQVAEAFRSYREQLRFFGGIVKLLGFRVSSIDVKHDARFAGESTYGWAKLFKLALYTIVAYSDKPLRIGIVLGFSISLLSVLVGIYYLTRALYGGIDVSGWASLIVSLYFIGGTVIGFIGLLGLYLGQVFDEAKRRPLYIVRERTFK